MRGFGVVSSLLVAMALFAGCTDNNGGKKDTGDDDDGTLPTVDEIAALFPIDNSASGCTEGFVVSLISFEQAAMSLPAGFTAADAQVMLATPLPTGMAAAFFTTFTCTEHAYENDSLLQSDLGIVVEAPDVPNATDTLVDFYVVHTFTANARLVAAFDATGYAHTAVAPSVDVMVLPTGSATADGEISDAEGVAAAYEINAPTPDAFTTFARFWHNATAGLVYTSYQLDEVPIAQGSATCTLREGSVFAQVTGRTDCPAQSTVALTLNGASWESETVFLPGVRAAV